MKTIIAATVVALLTLPLFSKPVDNRLFVTEKESKRINTHMQIVQTHMNGILDGISRGNWKVLQSNGDWLEKNFAKEFNFKKDPPKGFDKMVKVFLADAKALSRAAKNKKMSEVNKRFFSMIDSCMRCHVTYAPYKFQLFERYIPPREPPKVKYQHPDHWDKDTGGSRSNP